MKKFVKTIISICLVLCCALMLTACGGRLEGTYRLYSVSAEMGGQTVTVTVDEYNTLMEKEEADLTDEESAKLSIGSAIFVINQALTFKGGEAKLSITDDEGNVLQEKTGTYTLDGEDLSVVYGEEPAQTATYKNGQIIIESPMGPTGGPMTMIFKK